MFNTRFSIQEHHQRKKNTDHWDLRILNKKKDSLWSWAIPKARFPDGFEKLLLIRTPNHNVDYITFRGKLDNGDTVSLYDEGECRILVSRKNLIIIEFKGKRIKGKYNLIKLQTKNKQEQWLLIKSKK